MDSDAIRWTTRWPEPESGDYRVDIELGLVRDNTGAEYLNAKSIRISSDARAITTSVLRRVHVWTLVRRAISEQVAPIVDLMRQPARQSVVTDVQDGRIVSRLVDEDVAAEGRDAHWNAESRRLRIDEAASRSTGRERRPMTPDLLAEVAKVHAAARLSRDVGEPRRAVARHFHISESSASRWITKARDEGHLPPSGRARKKADQ